MRCLLTALFLRYSALTNYVRVHAHAGVRVYMSVRVRVYMSVRVGACAPVACLPTFGWAKRVCGEGRQVMRIKIWRQVMCKNILRLSQVLFSTRFEKPHKSIFLCACQCDFLHGLGVRERAQALFDAAKDDAAKESIMKQYERLTSPAEMGSLFKVLAITSNKIPTGTMPGFAMPGARDTRS